MAAKKKWTATHTEDLRRLHGEGLTCGQIAKQFGVSGTTVSRHAKTLGLDWAHTEQVANAAKTKRLSNLDKRLALETRLLDYADSILDQMDRPHTAFSFGGKDNVYSEQWMERPPVDAQKTIMSTAGMALDKALKLAETNTNSKDLSDLDLFLNTIMGENPYGTTTEQRSGDGAGDGHRAGPIHAQGDHAPH